LPKPEERARDETGLDFGSQTDSVQAPKGAGVKALAGILVAVVIAAATAAITYAVSAKQAGDAETKRAKGATRVLAENLRLAEDRLYSSLIDCRYQLYDFEVAVPPEDLLLVAWRLDPGQWEVVGRAIDQFNLQLRRSEGNDQLQSWDVAQTHAAIKYIDAARHALQEESGQEPSSPAALRAELARDCP
jgi:hypothetical protein